MHEWQVHVEGVGCIGTVHERNESLARCAALSRFGEDGPRAGAGTPASRRLYEDDEFSVARM